MTADPAAATPAATANVHSGTIRPGADTSTIVWLNGEQVSGYMSEKYREPALIGLQIHPGLVMKVEFCDLRVKAL
jgi:hypothetical protein